MKELAALDGVGLATEPVATAERELLPTTNATAKRKQSEFQVLYGIESCSGKYYVEMVDAQLNTWGKEVPRENIIIVGGPRDDAAVGIEEGNAFKCGDRQTDLACKEGLMLWRAVDRMDRVGANWLVVSQDDKYLWRKALDKVLREFDANKPQVLAPFGC